MRVNPSVHPSRRRGGRRRGRRMQRRRVRPCFQRNDFCQSNAQIIALVRPGLITFPNVIADVDRLTPTPSSCKSGHGANGELASLSLPRCARARLWSTSRRRRTGRSANREMYCKERVRILCG